jgi:ribosomal protein S5
LRKISTSQYGRSQGKGDPKLTPIENAEDLAGDVVDPVAEERLASFAGLFDKTFEAMTGEFDEGIHVDEATQVSLSTVDNLFGKDETSSTTASSSARARRTKKFTGLEEDENGEDEEQQNVRSSVDDRMAGFMKDEADAEAEVMTKENLEKALAFVSEDVDSTILEDPLEIQRDLAVNELLNIGKHIKITAGGRVQSFSALVMIGTGEATGGLGRGKGETVQKAMEKALLVAKRNMFSIARHRGCTISGTLVLKYKRTKVTIRACRMGFGVRASYEMRTVLKAFGLTDVSVSLTGRKTNIQAKYRAIFKGLQEGIQTPESLSRMTGRKIFDIHRTFYYRDQ